MNVTIKLVGVFNIGRFKEEVRKYPLGTSVREVIDDLQIPPPLLGIVLINDSHAAVDNPLSDGDSVCLLPFIDGG
ncbi:MoaD/ThiS family protein [Geobacter grbiciae]|uniref:MoaD/ThiS family protein n=1 Tax=Geobacter grbiciae TaxID=155042 RepID=UPI001C01F9CF|nr:MoaD/ThiS family protein [Geobacter grbiciae]MBT1076456.1 MoaD/ThiS family protein [Geobacter grbiciae]